MTMLRRIVAGTGANAYAQAASVVIQVVSLPVMLSYWSLETYGQWQVLSAIPAAVAMADVGMVTAAGNRMTMLVGEGRVDRANALFQSILAFVLAVCAAVALGVAAALALASFDADRTVALAALAASLLVSVAGGLPEAVYKATHRYALGSMLATTARLAEWAGGLAGLLVDGRFAAVALGGLAARLAFTLGMVVHASRSTPGFRWRFAEATVDEIRRCARPALSFMVFPAANALNFQGMTLVASATLGPAATAVFNAYRTLARVTVQATGTFSHALWPEFSRLYGARDGHSLRRLYRRSSRLAILLAAVGSAVVYAAAPTLLAAWSKRQIDFDAALMLLAMGYAALAGFWHVPRVLLLATNQHAHLAWSYLLASAAMLPLAWALAPAWGLAGLVAAMAAVEIAMAVLTGVLRRRVLGGGDAVVAGVPA